MQEKRICSPRPPPIPRPGRWNRYTKSRSYNPCCLSKDTTRNMLDRLLAEGYRADVSVYTNNDIIHAHASILGMASPVMKKMLEKSKSRDKLSIRGVPDDAVRIFLRFLYTSCYECKEMNQYALHLLVLSHVFAVPKLKEACIQNLERGLLTVENIVDVYQLALLCDAPRLHLLCHRLIVSNFKVISATEGWKVMRQSNPTLEKELLKSVIDSDWRRREGVKRMEERKIYLELHEAMEALVHICRDGCRTIGPHDKVLKRNAGPCSFSACRGLESLIRHFAGCKKRVLGGCIHCKRMWQLLELHSRLCTEEDGCRVPLCSHFKERMRQQNRKDEVKWRLLVSKVMEAKRLTSNIERIPHSCTSMQYSVSATLIHL